MARPRTAWTHFPVQLRKAAAEELPVDDRAIDSVVMTWTLCSVADPVRALSENPARPAPGWQSPVRRARAGPEPRLQRWQDRLTPVWRRLAGGCHLNRPIDQLVERSGLRLVELETGYLVKGPRVATYHYRGRALGLSSSIANRHQIGFRSAVIVLPSGGLRTNQRAGRVPAKNPCGGKQHETIGRNLRTRRD